MTMGDKVRKLAWMFEHPKKAMKAISKEYKREQAALVRREELDERIEVIRKSPLFDAEWYLRNHLELQGKDMDPAEHYLRFGGGRYNPSTLFCSEEYLSLHADIQNSQQNPLYHYETHGRNENRETSYLELREVEFPDGCVSCSKDFAIDGVKNRRTAVVSCFFADGCVPETLLFLLRGLKEVVDNIVLVGDCLIVPSEMDKLSDLVCHAEFERHEQYDFGSYKRGLRYARSHGLLDEDVADELVLINDSCFGPIFPFSESFDVMSKRPCDFWGYAGYQTAHVKKHISSFFLVFKRSVLDSGRLDDFLSRVEGKLDRGLVVMFFEIELTQYLADGGMLFETTTEDLESTINGFNYPLTFLRDYRVPLVKKKAFLRESQEDLNEVLRIIQENAPEIAQYVKIDNKPAQAHEDRLIDREQHVASFDGKVELLRSKLAEGKSLRTVFLITSASMFSARPLFDCMLEDSAFDPIVAVVPDFRRGDSAEQYMHESVEELRREGYQDDHIAVACADELGRWNDLCEGADIVVYSMPYYQISSFRYSPYYSVGRDFLPIMVNYGFYRSKYDRKLLALDAYGYMWKVLLECDETLEEYQRFATYGGENAVETGYVKMDSLAKKVKHPSDRKTVLVALHHSIEGGMNDTLSLANFIRYLDYFRDLPDKYPELDFIYRPHPFLFDALKRVEGWDDRSVLYFIREMKMKPNVTWSDGGDYLQEFADSDACIQDCGSFLVEYLYTGNPCCYMLKEPGDREEKFVELGKECLDQCYLAYSTDEIDSFIADVVLGGNDTKREAREDLASHVMHNYPHAADAALENIKQSIMG